MRNDRRNLVVLAAMAAALLTSYLAIAQEAAKPAPAPPAQTAPAAQPQVPKPTGPVPAEQMQGLSWDGLTDAQKQLVVQLLNENLSDCGSGKTIAVERRDAPTCKRSLELATQVIALAKQGKGRDEIVKTALTPAWKFVQFPIAPGDAPSVGPADAKVVIQYYYDYQCPFCVRLGATFDQFLPQYPKDVRVVFKQHPLPMHAQAGISAQGALAAHKQGKFLEMHKKLYESSSQLSRDKVLEIAKGLGLDMDRFAKDMDSDAVKNQIAAETKEVEAIGASGTPASFVNGRYVSGAKPLEFWKTITEEELKWAREGNRPQFTVGKNVRDTMPPQAAQRGPDASKVYDLAMGKAPVLGNSSAKVTILHFYDYQCPFCIRVGPTLEQLLKDYPNDVRIAFMQHPLPMHGQAMIASQAAMAAAAQGKFEPMHKKLHEMNARPDREKILQAAKDIGLDVDRFTKEIDGNSYKAAIDEMTKTAMDVGATGTPASFVNGRYLSGAQPIEAFKKLVDEEIAKAKGGGAGAGS